MDGDRIELGSGHWAEKIELDGVWVGIMEHHPRPDNGEPHEAYCLFAIPEADRWAARFVNAQPTRWQVPSLEPLTMTPSILCKDCGNHGYITGGRWS